MDFQKYNIKKSSRTRRKERKKAKLQELLKNNNNNHTQKIYIAFTLKIGYFFLKSDSRL